METQTIRRILVALDTSTDSLTALETAVKLAANLQTELVGLFVEDVNLLRLAELPFSRETRYYTTTNLDPTQREQAHLQLTTKKFNFSEKLNFLLNSVLKQKTEFL